MRVITSMKNISNDCLYDITLFYYWNVCDKLKGHTHINPTGEFYYRLVAFIYNALDDNDILNEDDYFNEDG
jgi:hypothetical protein